jgi:hypothetical protein
MTAVEPEQYAVWIATSVLIGPCSLPTSILGFAGASPGRPPAPAS